MNRQRWTLLIIAIIAIGLPLGWYLVSPLFIDNTVDEDFPTVSDANIFDDPEMGPKATEMMEDSMALADTPMEEDMPEEMDTMTVLFQGAIYDIAHEGMGTATIYQLADGSRVLRFEDFEVLNGPELHVYLSPDDPIPDTVGNEIAGSVDLGLLKGNIGNQNYDIPADLDLSVFGSVVIWCEPFRVPFNAAPLGTP